MSRTVDICCDDVMFWCDCIDIMMSTMQYSIMRTTLTLDDDVAAKVRAMMRRTGKSFKATVNDLLREALAPRRVPQRREPFRVEARDLGALKPGLTLDNVAELLEQVEGPRHR
jgi:Arc/MetJ family transcription regulator